MDTVQVSAVKAAIQFCEDGNTIRKHYCPKKFSQT